LAIVHLELIDISARVAKQDVAGAIAIDVAGPDDTRRTSRPNLTLGTPKARFRRETVRADRVSNRRVGWGADDSFVSTKRQRGAESGHSLVRGLPIFIL
jgi:hypothetical protein